MNPHQMYSKQLEKWLEITTEFVDKTEAKAEKDITIEDIITIAQKLKDVENVLTGKSKMSGWRL